MNPFSPLLFRRLRVSGGGSVNEPRAYFLSLEACLPFPPSLAEKKGGGVTGPPPPPPPPHTPPILRGLTLGEGSEKERLFASPPPFSLHLRM